MPGAKLYRITVDPQRFVAACAEGLTSRQLAERFQIARCRAIQMRKALRRPTS